MKANGDLKAISIDIHGSLKTTGKIEAETIIGHGAIKCQTQISADRIEIRGEVAADEIVGDYIEIKKAHLEILSGLLKPFTNMHTSNHVCANLIEATTIILEDVRAGVVSGENVTIGENCRIDRLDCTGAYTIDPTSTVRILNGEPYNK